jgi:hypothetical protein
MKHIIKKFQEIMSAATFAEAGEWDTAMEMIPETPLSRQPSWLSKIFMAVTFAESGMHSEALYFLEPAGTEKRNFNARIMEELGLKGVRLLYGTVSI